MSNTYLFFYFCVLVLKVWIQQSLWVLTLPVNPLPACPPDGTSCTVSLCTSSSCANCSSCWARTLSCSCCASASIASSMCCCAAWHVSGPPSCSSAAGTTRLTADTEPCRSSWILPGARCACRERLPCCVPSWLGSSWCSFLTEQASRECLRSSIPFSGSHCSRLLVWSFWAYGWSCCK